MNARHLNTLLKCLPNLILLLNNYFKPSKIKDKVQLKESKKLIYPNQYNNITF